MSFFEMREVFRPGLVMFRLDVFTLDHEKATHICHVLRQACRRAFGDRHHQRKKSRAHQESKMKLSHVIDVLVLADGPAGDDENGRAFHGSNVCSAFTSLTSFSRPCEATRM